MKKPAGIPEALPTPQERNTLGFLLREAYDRLQLRVYAMTAEAGFADLRPAHSTVLRHLPLEGGRAIDIARAAGLAKQSVAYLVQDLISLGYLKASADPADGRAQRIDYSERGKRLIASLVDASRTAEAELTGLLGDQLAPALREALEQITAD